jgi:hypothetical protein
MCLCVDRFPNIGIQCCKRHDVEESLKLREKIRVDPFGSKFSVFAHISSGSFSLKLNCAFVSCQGA